MDTGEFLGLSLPVMAAFIALLLGLALVARQLHRLSLPTLPPVLRPGAARHGQDPQPPLNEGHGTSPDAGERTRPA